MSGCISLGECNKNYIYLISYILLRIIKGIIYDLANIYEKDELLSEFVFTQEVIIYFGMLILSLLYVLYDYYKENYIFYPNINDVDENIRKSCNIQNNNENEKKNNEFNKKDWLIFIYYALSNLLMKVFFSLGFAGLDYWMFEILIISFFMKKYLKISIYNHKIFAICFIIILSSIMKIISTISIFNDTEEKNIYKKFKILIPFIVIFFLIISLIRAYVTIKIKQIFDEKFITKSGFLFLYNIFGLILSAIISIFPNNFPCNDDEPDLKEFICKIPDEKNISYYYDSYSIFLNRTNEKTFIYSRFFFFKIVLDFFINLCSLYTICKLDPTYYICSSSIYYCFYRLIKLIKKFKDKNFFEFLAEVFSFIGIIIYLEFIKLKCFKLDFDLIENINKRSDEDILLTKIEYKEEKEEEDDNENENENKEIN